ncbi:hypothetical protein TcasGA2_TC007001 [Tribolium castaneum]|uniref:Uncharacterized protein n=1 Tax=Tribolium castaneum TaxID=7070 RepID=D2A337_TRICA|nr:hypothetical protein TcasGA2_TC007001 [Tribolium castaneum]
MVRHPVFTKEDEALLTNQVIKLSKVFHGISPTEIKRCAFAYAKENNIQSIFLRYLISRLATPKKAIKGFKETGIFPLNPNLFTEEDFAGTVAFTPAEPADLVETLHKPNIEAGNIENKSDEADVENEIIAELHGTSTEGENNILESVTVSFSELMPLPGPSGINSTKQKQSNRKQHSEIFTSTPMKAVLDEKEEKIQLQLQKKMKDTKSKSTKRKVFEEDNVAEQDNIKTTEIRGSIKRHCKKSMTVTEERSPEEEDDEDSSDKEVNEDICIVRGDIGKHRCGCNIIL